MSIQFQIKGQLELGNDLRRMRARVLETAGRELTLGLMGVEAKSKPITPVKTGMLRAATYVTPATKTSANEMTASIYNNQDYAQYVHEMREPIKWTTPGTGAKFIELPLRAALPDIELRIAKSIEDLAEGGK